MFEINSLFKIIDLPGAEELGKQTAEKAGEIAGNALTLAGNPMILIVGVVLVIATIAIIFFLKKIIINSVLGIICWVIVKYAFAIELAFFPSLIVSILFGPAGIGVMLLLKFFNII